MKSNCRLLLVIAALALGGIACALPGGAAAVSGDCPGVSSPAKSGPGTYDGGDGYTTTQKGPIKLGGGECRGTLNDLTSADNWTLEGKAKQSVTISVKAVGDSDPSVALIDPSGNEIDFDDDSGGGTNALLTATLPQDGVYTLRVTMYTEGSYTISAK